MTQRDDDLMFRPFEEGDFERLANLVGKTWLAEFPARAQMAAGRVELAHYLDQTTWSLVAEREGALLGAVLLSERGRGTIADDWARREARLTEDAKEDPELLEAIRVEMSGVEEEAALEAEYAASGAPGAAAAVKLLIVSPDAKGLGIGGRLFSAAIEHLHQTGAKGYHLLTDDACDVSFYEHKGLSQAMSRRSQAYWPDVDPSTDTFRVYVYEQRL